MQDALFPDAPDVAGAAGNPPARKARSSKVEAVTPGESTAVLAARLPPQLHMGTSSWFFPGWKGLVWEGDHAESKLSREGLTPYSRHPLLRSVSIDRSFYRPMSASQFAAYAAQVPEDFRFVVKAPSLVTDVVVRSEEGKGKQDNPAFLSPELAASEFVQPAIEGLGHKIGALVFQLSPLPGHWLARLDEVLERLRVMLASLPDIKAVAPHAAIAVEVRNAQFLTPAFAGVLRGAGATYCLGLHAKMPAIEEQLPLLRALWPAPLVCRWSLNRKHGAYGYEEAKGLYEPFDKLVDPDPETRETLARVMAATAAAGLHVYVTINNKAEGSAPLSVGELARAVAARL
jgi:uncharacterized protein YecE (DUF72 family)